MIVAKLTRTSAIRQPEEFDKRAAALDARLLPYLREQPGFVSHELRREGDGGSMVELTSWGTAADCSAFLRGGAAAMAATWLDAYLPTAAFPDGNWIRETYEATE
jgi:heme-degrading monooxygenase HmoA